MINELKLLRGIKQYDFFNGEYYLYMKEIEPGILGVVDIYDEYGGTFINETKIIQMKGDISLYIKTGRQLIEGVYIWGHGYTIKDIMESILRAIEEYAL